MGKDKLKRFAENESFKNLFQPEFNSVYNSEYEMQGKWRETFFKNDNPIVLELGCGRGEYTVGMGKNDASRNYIGIDIKGARLWRGAKTAIETGMDHIAFVRTRIEVLDSIFGKDEVDEIWVTFPDPQLKPRRAKKRLTGSLFLNMYRKMLKENGTVNLKSDSAELYAYTSELLKANNIIPEISTDDLYNSEYGKGILNIRTHYESMFLEVGKKITYLRFQLPKKDIEELPMDLIKQLAGFPVEETIGI